MSRTVYVNYYNNCRDHLAGYCSYGRDCRFRHDVRKCSCDLVILLKYYLPHIRGNRHRRLLRDKKLAEEYAQQGASSSGGAAAPNAPEVGKQRCEDCKKFFMASELVDHVVEHQKQKRMAEIRATLREAEQDKEGITVSCKNGINYDVLDEGLDTVEYNVEVANARTDAVALQSCRMRSSFHATTQGKLFSAQLKGNSKLIQPNVPRTVSVIFQPTYAGTHEDVLELVFAVLEPRSTFIITRRVTATVGSNEDHEQLKAKAPYTRRKVESFMLNGKVIRDLRTQTGARTVWAERLPQYEASPALIKVAYGMEGSSQKVILQAVKKFMPQTFNENTYGRWFEVMLHVEEERVKRDLDAYSMSGAELDANGPRYNLKVEGLAENRPSVLVGDHIHIGREGDVDRRGVRIWYEGRVEQIHQNHVTLRFDISFSSYKGTKYDVRFVLNRISYRRMHHVISNDYNPARLLFPDVVHLNGAKRTTAAQRESINPFYRLLRGDEEQMETVAAIVNQPPGSVPFVVFGPPGTGKTVTIVEAMRQLLHSYPDVRILACAPNNSAADLIAQKLTSLGTSQLFRLNAPTRRISDSPKELKDFTYINENDVFAIPSVDELKKYRVVVSTCLSGSTPAQLGIKRGHFSHIFVDEAGQGKEPEVIAPIKSIADNKTNIILAGDNQQLGPIVHSPLARELGLNTSYLSRIMARDIYSLDPGARHGGRGITIVKLRKNFRSHPDILEFPNAQFYDTELESCGDPAITRSLENSDELPTKKFPIVFHGIVGRDERESASPSFFNIDEATQVKKYCQNLISNYKYRLTAEHIGVITPYHAQRCKIMDLLRKDHKLKDIKVGSVEEFQGQERRIIIISTVRSNTEYITADIRRSLGFVANGRRFNVAITRAQAMLIVVGNPVVLSLDPLWRAFLNFIYKRGGWRGKTIDWDPDGDIRDYMDGYRKSQAEKEMEETTQRLKAIIMRKHEDEDYEFDNGDNANETETPVFDRPILREAE